MGGAARRRRGFQEVQEAGLLYDARQKLRCQGSAERSRRPCYSCKIATAGPCGGVLGSAPLPAGLLVCYTTLARIERGAVLAMSSYAIIALLWVAYNFQT